jgi:hypothetical protein
MMQNLPEVKFRGEIERIEKFLTRKNISARLTASMDSTAARFFMGADSIKLAHNFTSH